MLEESAEEVRIGGVGTEGGPSSPAALSVARWSRVDTVASLHASRSHYSPSIEFFIPSDSSLVLGRAQDSAIINYDALRARGASLVVRESGGGAVWVTPENLQWFDVVVPRDHVLHADDVNQAFLWLGRCFVDILQANGYDAVVHDGAFYCPSSARSVCLAAVGPGEVTVDGKKVVGLSQRRTREGSRFHCAVVRQWEPTCYSSLLAGVSAEEIGSLVGEIPDFDVAGLIELVNEKLASTFCD